MSNSFMNNNTAGSAVAGPTAVDSMDDDLDVLQFGTHIDVTNDAKQAVMAELQELHTMTQAVQHDLQHEKKLYAQVQQDQQHRTAEMKNLQRDAREAVANLQMNDAFRQAQARTLAAELSLHKTTSPLTVGAAEEGAAAHSNKNSDDIPTSVMALGEHVQQRRAILRDTAHELRTLSANLRLVEANNITWQEQVEAQAQVVHGLLQPKLEELQRFVQQEHEALDNEDERQRAMQLDLEKAEAELVALTAQVEKAEQEQAETDKKAAGEIAELQQQLDAKTAAEQAAQADLDDMDREIAVIEAQTLQIEQDMAKYQRLQSELAAVKAAQKEERALRNAAYTKKVELEAAITKHKTDYDAAQRYFESLQKDEEILAKLKSSNDQFEAEKLGPLQDEIASFKVLNAKLEQQIAAAEQNAELLRLERHLQALTDKTAAINAHTDQLLIKKAQLEREEEQLAATNAEQERRQAEIVAGLEQAVAAAELQEQQAEKERAAAQAQKVEQDRQVLLAKLYRKLEVCRRGSKLVKAANKKQREIEEGARGSGKDAAAAARRDSKK